MNIVHSNADAVRSCIANGLLSTNIPEALGDIVLRPHQRDAVARLHDTLADLHVALLADDVGLGKTFVALAVARRYGRVRIIAPAALLPMWRQAAIRAQSRGVEVESLQRYSRTAPTSSSKHSPHDPHNTLVIIDEAHHLRTPTTRRYRAVSDSIAGHDLLLLSATPLHNSARDLQSLLALSLGTAAKRLTPALLARAVVRRTQPESRPTVREIPAHIVPHDRAILDAILTLPAPLPAHDGAVAGALIRLGLLRAWCSSDAALSHSLRRRLLRGEALRHALESGRHPTAAELRSWLVGEHEVQLAFPELLANHTPETGPLVEILSRHLDAVQSLLAQHGRTARADAIRADTLRKIVADHRGAPVVAFSQFAETVRALGRALSDIAGVGVLTSRRAWIASGPITRDEALALFAPKANGRPPPPPHLRIRLLLATDLLAEGVNLQDAGVVVHLDLPWTDALRVQRVGRCVRLGSPHAEVTVHRFELPDGAEAAMRLYRRLQRKATLARRLVGGIAPTRTTQTSQVSSAADSASRLRTLLSQWMRPAESDNAGATRQATLRAARGGFVALVRDPLGNPRLLAGALRIRREQTRLVISTSPSRVLRLLEQPQEECESCTTSGQKLSAEWIQRAVKRWRQRVARDHDLGRQQSTSPGRSSAHQRVSAELRVALSRLPASQRVVWREAFAAAEDMLRRVRGASAERELICWLEQRSGQPLELWIRGWRSYPILEREAGRRWSGSLDTATVEAKALVRKEQPVIVAMLVLQPC